MASKVMVKMPVAPFGKVNKSKSGNVNGEIMVSRPQEVPSKGVETPKSPENARIAQLEQNIKFLQEQHQLMLTGLHNEIESLKNKNRELQFQLVFVKGNVSISGSPSSSEDDAKHKVYSSPKTFNLTPLQVEILEKELGEVKHQLQEIESRNVFLSSIVDEQQKKLESYERDREKELELASQPDPELLKKLEDAEIMIRRLRRDNSDLRRENTIAAGHYQQRDNNQQPQQQQQQQPAHASPRQGRGNGSGRHRPNNGHYRGNWFPPLHSQSYWQGGRGGVAVDGASLLPTLPTGGEPPNYQGRRGANNNHYHNGEGRKYKGGQKNHKPS